jgi:hypothetical protein
MGGIQMFTVFISIAELGLKEQCKIFRSIGVESVERSTVGEFKVNGFQLGPGLTRDLRAALRARGVYCSSGQLRDALLGFSIAPRIGGDNA